MVARSRGASTGMNEVACATDADRDAKLTLDQLALALRNLGPNHWFMPLYTAIICVMFSRWVETPRLIAWFVLVTCRVVPLGIVSVPLPSASSPIVREAKAWVLRATLAYLVFASAWASMVIFLWVPDSQIAQMIIVMLLGLHRRRQRRAGRREQAAGDRRLRRLRIGLRDRSSARRRPDLQQHCRARVLLRPLSRLHVEPDLRDRAGHAAAAQRQGRPDRRTCDSQDGI